MAEFAVREVEGMRQVMIDLRDETVRARRGALSNMRGAITLTPKLPRLRDVFRSIFTDEARIRPYYDGTGSILLQPSLGGYHVLDLGGFEEWILEPGVYWASEGSVELGLFRERLFPSLWAGDGLFPFKTTLRGRGAHAPLSQPYLRRAERRRCRPDRAAFGLGPPGARPRRRALHRPARPLRHHPGARRRRQPGLRRWKRCAPNG
jgi:hypothetical protein